MNSVALCHSTQRSTACTHHVEPLLTTPLLTTMPTRFIWLIALFLLLQPAAATPPGWQLDLPADPALPQLTVAAVDASARRKSDDLDHKPGRPLQVATGRKLDINVLAEAEMRTLADGQRIARLAIRAPGATDISLAFTDFQLPEGAALYLYDAERSLFQGHWDARQNRAHRQFRSPAVPGDTAILEVVLSPQSKRLPVLQLAQVQAGFRDLFGRQGGPFLSKSHGACNIDVACPQGDAWRDQIRSVARYTFDVDGQSFLCTGTLINDVPGSLTPWFLTAEHCAADNAASVVVYWNFEASNCGAQSAPLSTQTQSGATLRAARRDVDMRLLQLDEPPDASFNVHYAGWDRISTPASGAVGIHHPQGDVKSISISNNPLSVSNNCIAPGSNTHWRVGPWDQGTTEPGSSGSAIWNPLSKRLVGFLSGGNASCANTSGTDCYGRFDVAWDGPTAAERLRDWLDPNNNSPLALSGTDPAGFVLGSPSSEFSQCGTEALAIPVTLTALNGFNRPVTLSVSGLPAGASAGFSANPVTPSVTTTLTLANLAIGTHPFTITGNADGLQRSLELALRQFDQAPGSPALLTPADGAVDIDMTTAFSWQALPQASGYQIQIATDAAFTNIVRQLTSATTAVTLDTPLAGATRHYVRVRASNDCGDGPWSQVRTFTTVQMFCATPALSIPDNNNNGIQSQINVPTAMTIGNLDLLLDISHSWVGDLQVELRQQSSGRSRVLVNRPPGNGSCSGSDMVVTLDDVAPLTIQNDCGSVNAYTEARYRPANSLAVFADTELMTTWTLNVADQTELDSGTLNRWCLVPRQQSEAIAGDDGGGGGGSLSLALLLTLALLLSYRRRFPLRSASHPWKER